MVLIILIICLIATLAFACGTLAIIALTNIKNNNTEDNKKDE